MVESTVVARSIAIYTAQTMPERSIFVDTGYFVALLNGRDSLHGQAVALASKWKKAKRSFITHDAVLIELANFFARSALRSSTLVAIRRIRAAVDWNVQCVDAALLARSERRYGAHVDKEWSLTDCISMEVMADFDSTEAATPDKHFAQAGFRVLMR